MNDSAFFCCRHAVAKRSCAVLLLLAAALSGCAPDRMRLPATLPEPKHADVVNVVPLAQVKDAGVAAKRFETIKPLSADHRPEQAASGLNLPAGNLMLNADSLPLNRFIHMALGDILHIPFEIEPAVSKRTDPVTLHVTKAVSSKRLLGMVEAVLKLYDIAMVSTPDSGVRVISTTKLATSPPAVSNDRLTTLIRLGRIMEFVPLSYADPVEVLDFSRYFLNMGRVGAVLINQRLNALLVIGDAEGLRGFHQALDLIDRPALQGRHLQLVRPLYWHVSEMAKALRKALEAQGVRVADKTGMHKGLRLIVVEPINALIVASPRKDWLNLMQDWVARFDQPEAVGGGSKKFIYFVKNARAKDLGAVIMQTLSGKSGAVARDKGAEVVGLAKKIGEKAKQVKRAEPVATPEQGNLAVITDETHNVLIFVGSAEAYRGVLPLLKALDKPPRQVLIEATVAEVKLDNSTQFGVEAAVNNVDNSSSMTGLLSTIGGLGVGSAGLSYTLLNAASAVRVKINALASQGRAKILSSPTLLAMDNETAHIQIGDQVAVLTQEIGSTAASTGTTTGILRSFSYVDTGVILNVTPTINVGGVVRMVVHQEVSRPGASSNNTPPISRRSVDTTLVAKSGQTVLIGGLISHNKTLGRTKVPFLGDIPILGHLFSNDTITDSATELVLLITPHIISNSEDAEYLTRAFQRQLNWQDSNDDDSSEVDGKITHQK